MMQSLGLILGMSLIFFFAYLLVISPPLVEVVLHAVSKTMYDKTRGKIFKILMNATKSNDSTSIIRYTILFAYISLPLFVIFVSMVLSVEYVFNTLLVKVRSFPLLAFEIAYVFLFSYAIMVLIHFSIMKYGAVYKLSFLSLVRRDIRQFLEEHGDIQVILIAGSFLFSITIIALLLDLVNAYTPLSIEIIVVIVVILLIEVIFNKKYDNTIKLIERLTSSPP